MRFITSSLAVLFLLNGLAAHAQDLTIVSKDTHDGGQPETSISYISSEHVRMSHGAGKEAILDFKSGAMTTLDSKKKTYYVTTRADMDAFAAKMQEQMNSPEMKKMRERMNSVPAEQRQKADAEAFKVDVRDLGTARKIAGYTCENWKMDLGEYTKSELCVTSELQYPTKAFEMYRGFSESMKSMTTAFGPSADSTKKMQDQFKKMKGYPMASTSTTEIMGHKSVIATEVTEVRHGAIPASVWQVPAGYTRVDNPMLRALQAHSRR